MSPLTLGFSPCPNDTFLFDALVNGRVPSPMPLIPRLEDVETLNRLVLDEALDVSKISFHLYGHVREKYVLLRSGAALGRGCGPLVVVRKGEGGPRVGGRRIAIPGRFTTAALLLRLYDPEAADLVEMPFDRIMPAVVAGEVDAGVIIHESRFTYSGYGLEAVVDLGEWWERETGHPIPLGGIVAKRSLGRETIIGMEKAVAASVGYAFEHPDASRPYVRQHAREMDDEVCRSHISLYVTAFTRSLGSEGEAAVAELLRKGEQSGLFVRKTDLGMFA